MHWKGNINISNSLPLLLFIGEKFTLWLVCFRYGTKFMDDYQDIMTKKLGLPKYNKQLIGKLLTNMAVDKVDYTNFFRTLSNIKADTSIPDDELLVPLKSVLLDIGQERKEAWTSWLKTYIYEV
jgi:serine/tyrosine/threonine adenylyltransferase